MTKPEFDKFAAEYDQLLDHAIPDAMDESSYFSEYKVALVDRRLKTNKPEKILDFGCGTGRSLVHLDKHFPDSAIYGYDVSSDSAQIAASRSPRAKISSDWERLPSNQFDAVLVANVLHHIPPTERAAELTRCRNVLSDKGRIFVFEHNPLNPLTRWVFNRCPLDATAEMLRLSDVLGLADQVGLKVVWFQYTLFFPRPLAFLRKLEPLLGLVPLGAQYCVELR